MSSPEPPPSIFGTDADPRADTALSPWVWLPLTFLTVVCVLFVSLRRAHALELYDRGLSWLHEKLPFLSNSPTSTGHIRLHPQDLEALRPSLSSGAESDSDDGDSPSFRDEVDTSDELPQPYAYTPRARVLGAASSAGGKMKQLASGALDTLGWGATPVASWTSGGAGKGDKDARIARAFWGTRHGERAGGIKLDGPTSPPSRPQGGLSGFGGLLERVTDVAGSRLPPSTYSTLPSSPRRAPPSPSSRSSSRRGSAVSEGLFELGEEDEGEGAVELPREFELSDPLGGSAKS